jgi:hypothetical protein
LATLIEIADLRPSPRIKDTEPEDELTAIDCLESS